MLRWQSCWESNADDKSFVGKDGVGENALSLLQESIFVLNGGAEMAYAKLPHPCISSQGGCLQGCGVHGLFRSECTFVEIGRFVIEQIDAINNVFQLWQIDGIGAVGIRARRCGWRGEAFVRDDDAVLGCPRSTGLDVIDLADRNAIGVYHLPSDVWQVRLLAEKIAAGGKPVLQGDAADRDAAVFVNEVVPSRIDGMEEHFVLNLGIVSAHEELEQFAHLLRAVYVELGSTAQQVHRAYQSRQSEDVVTMVVADEDMSDAHHGEPHPLHLSLHALATIYHEEFAPHVQDLRGGLVACGGLGRAATQYVQFEIQNRRKKRNPRPFVRDGGFVSF